MSKENTKLLTNLANLLFELFKKDENEAIEFLKEEGISLEEFDKENELFMRKLMAKAKVELGKKDRDRKIQLLQNAVNKLEEMDDEELRKILSESELSQLSFQFRNLKKPLSQKAEYEILKDEQLLKVMEKLVKYGK